MASLFEQTSGQELQLCYEEGFRAFVKRQGRNYLNPYNQDSPDHGAYHRGWCYGCEIFSINKPRDPVKIIPQLMSGRTLLPDLRLR